MNNAEVEEIERDHLCYRSPVSSAGCKTCRLLAEVKRLRWWRDFHIDSTLCESCTKKREEHLRELSKRQTTST